MDRRRFLQRSAAGALCDARTGKLAWTHEIGATTWCSPQVVDGKVLSGAMDGYFHCFA